MSAAVRPPAVAGTFYPGDPAALAALVDELVDAVAVPDDDRLATAYIVPHAGYRYSGRTAAQVYARLRRHAADVRRVVLIGPAHRVPLRGCAVTRSGRWRTPLGEVNIDEATAGALTSGGFASVNDAPHAPEHSLEVQVPFLQRVLEPVVTVLPVCVGLSSIGEVAALIEAAVSRSPVGTVVVCSTDLSHYLPDAQARERDRRTARAILSLAPERIGVRDACGVFALRGLLSWAAGLARDESSGSRLRATQLALDTSADTAGDPVRVVGYPAFALHGQ